MAKRYSGRMARARGAMPPKPRAVRPRAVYDPLMEGVIRLTRQGYAFLEVRPESPGTVVNSADSRDDVKIESGALGGALHGDKVRVRVLGERFGARRRGVVVEILERAHPRFVAVTVSATRVVPEDERNPYEFQLDPLDPSCPSDLRPGWKLLVEAVTWPGADDDPESELPRARILEVLGPAGKADTETAAILANLGIETDFDEEVLAVARSLPQEIPAAERARRLDLTNLMTVTIDPADARDFDDALSVETLPDGNLRVGIHIADVSNAVPAGSLLDDAARDRGVSVYLPDRAIPMLPEEIANNLCSLRPNEERLAKTVFIDFTPEGERLRHTIHRSVIRSVRRFTYEEVRDLLDPEHVRAPLPEIVDGPGSPLPGTPAVAVVQGEAVATTKKTSRSGRYKAFGTPPEPTEALAEMLGKLDQLAQSLRKARFDAGAIELDLYEVRVRIDDDDQVLGIEKQVQDFSHQLVEEFMLAANRAVGEWAVQAGAGVLHRVHEAPSPERFGELCEYLTSLGHTLKPPPDRRKINAVLESVKGQPSERGVNMAVLRALAQAHYAPDADIGHFALAFPRYVHFTSPIRRYPDLHLHQVIDGCFAEGAHQLPNRAIPAARGAHAALVALGNHCSERERRAMKAETETAEFRRLEWLARHEIGHTLNATVTGVKRFGVFVEVEGYFVEGLLPKVMVESAGYALREEIPPSPGQPKGKPARKATGHPKRFAGERGFWLGQRLRVQVVAVDLPDRRCRLALRARD